MAHDGQTIELPPGVTNTRGYITHAWEDGAAVAKCPDGRWYAAGCDELQLGYPNGAWRYFPDAQSAARALYALNVGPGAKKDEPEGPWHDFPGRDGLTFLGNRNGSDLYLDTVADRLVRVYAAGCAEQCQTAVAGESPIFADALALARERGLLAGPRYKHDNEGDVWLGRFREDDLYYSAEYRGHKNRVIARRSDAPVTPMHGDADREPVDGGFSSMNEARRLVRQRGLIPEPAPALPAGYDPKWIPADYEYRGEVRPPKTGEWYLHEGLNGPSRATWDFTHRFPILVPKENPAEPPTPATLAYRDEWPTPCASEPQPKKENPMPETTPAPQGRPLTKEEFERLVLLRDRFTINEAPKAALNAYARWLHLQVNPSATFDEPAPTPPPVPAAPAAYVQTLQPIPGVFARVLGAAGIALLTGLATLAGVAGGGMLLLHHFAR